MPVVLSKLEENGVLLKGSGVVTFREIKEVNDQLYSDTGLHQPISYQICDYRDIKDLKVSSSEVRVLSEQDREGAEDNPGMLIAVVGNNELTFGMSRMWEQVFSLAQTSCRVASFRSVEEARSWIQSEKRE